MPRIRLTLSTEAQDSLMELQRKMKKLPSEVINELLVEQHRSLQDDELCKKEYFSSCIIYEIIMPFCFPYECECFNFHINKRDIRLYLERVPKRYVAHRLPFNTRATIIIKLNNARDFPKNVSHAKIQKTILDNIEKLAHNLLKKTIIFFRRITEDYYNIGTIKPPMFLDEFNRNTKIIIIHKNQYFSTLKRMPIKEGSEIIVIHKLDDKIRNKIINDISLKESDILFYTPYDFFDQSIISYYDEEWNICLIQGVIAMESALSHLIFKSKLTEVFIQKEVTEKALKKAYKKASSLPKKICRFLFPILKAKNLIESEDILRQLMPLIANKRTEEGIYDLRSKVVHEGLVVSEKDAKKTIEIMPQFFSILITILE